MWIKQFNGRAYFAMNPGGATPPSVMCSDVIGVASGPLSRSAAVAGVILTFGDTTNVVAMGTLALTNLTTGGVIQALYVFKSATLGAPDIFQITGDVGTSNLSLQKLNANVSTTAPNSIVSTPLGLFFVAPDGLRYIDTQGHVQAPVGYGGTGMTSIFTNAVPQSRIAAAYDSSLLVFGLNNSVSGNIETWCYDTTRQMWHGPHTFPSGLLSSLGNSFLVSPYVASGAFGLYNLSFSPSSASTYTELGLPMTCTATTSLAPDRKEITNISTVKSVLYAGYPASGATYVVTMTDVDGNVLGTCNVVEPAVATAEAPFEVPWTAPIPFDRMAITISTTAAAGIRMGSFHLPYTDANYTVRYPGA